MAAALWSGTAGWVIFGCIVKCLFWFQMILVTTVCSFTAKRINCEHIKQLLERERIERRRKNPFHSVQTPTNHFPFWEKNRGEKEPSALWSWQWDDSCRCAGSTSCLSGRHVDTEQFLWSHELELTENAKTLTTTKQRKKQETTNIWKLEDFQQFTPESHADKSEWETTTLQEIN